MVSEPHEEHLMLSPDSSYLENLLPRISRRVCFTASEPPRPVKHTRPGKRRSRNTLARGDMNMASLE